MLRDILRRNKPSPLEATSVAMRMGAFPYLNSVEVGKQVKSSELTKNELIRDLYGKHIPLSTQSLSCWLLSPWIPIAGHLQQKKSMKFLHLTFTQSNRNTAEQRRSSYPSLRILLVRSSHLLLVSTKIMVLFSFSLMISSSRRISLERNEFVVMHSLTQPSKLNFSHS